MIDDHALAARLATGAGEVLLALRAAQGPEDFDGRAFKDAGDAAAQAWLAEQVAELAPGDKVLSEEAADDVSRVDADRVWIIDPLDGTREFSEREDGVWRTDWAVHVALWERSADGLTAGAVALPARGITYSTAEPPTREPVDESRPLRIAVSRSRPPAIVQAIQAAHDVEFVAMGSAGVKTIAAVTGEVDAYIHAGGQYEWDSAAPVAVANAAGLFTARIDGSPLVYNNANPWLPDLVVCPVEVRDRVMAWVAEAANQTQQKDPS